MSARAWLWWGLTRLVVLGLLVTVETGAGFDLTYYADALADLDERGVDGTLREYPVPALGLLALPYGLLAVAGATAAYPLVVVLLALALDAVFLAVLVRRAGHDQSAGGSTVDGLSAGAAAWLAAPVLLGPLTYARYDLVPGVLVALAVLALATSPARAGLLAALASGLKLSPVLVLPGLAAPVPSRRPVVVATAIAGGLLAGASLLAGGWDRLVSPLTYQGDRGLQIESVAATPAMLARLADPGPYEVFYAPSKAWEVEGPGTDALLAASTGLTVLLAVVLVVLWVAAWRRLGRPSAAAPSVVWLVLGATSAFVVSGKVLSPQYLLWLLPAACAGVAVLAAPEHRDERRRLGWWTGGLLVAAGLTQVVYPLGYRAVLDATAGETAVVLCLALRNALLVVLCAAALVGAVRSLRAEPRRRPGRATSAS